jgi:putative transposase
MMKVMKGYKTELDLNNAQITACLKACGTARFVYNWGIKRYQEEYAAGRKTPTAISLHKELNALKKTDFPWMYEVSKCAPQEALRNLEKAFKNFFNNVKKKKSGKFKGKLGYPKLKTKKKGIGSFRLTGAIHVYEKHIQLPRLGRLLLKEAHYIPTSYEAFGPPVILDRKLGSSLFGPPVKICCTGTKQLGTGTERLDVHILSATISEKAGRWFVSVQVEEEVAAPVPATGKVLGVDLGIKTLATTSEAEAFENPKALRKNLKQLARLGRRVSRKKKGSKNRKKAVRRLARKHARIARIRANALHQATHAIAKTKPCTIVLEDLNVKGMMKNRKLSRAVGDVGMYEFKRQITYKAEKYGSMVNTVSRWFPSSKTCSCCGWVDEDLDLSDRVFVCERCGYVADRDYNAAKNLAQTELDLKRTG